MLADRQKNTFAKKLKSGEELWVGAYCPTGVSEEDRKEAEEYSAQNGIKYFIYKYVIVFYSDESQIDKIKERVKYQVEGLI